MRAQAYWFFALVAWPAAVWGVVEIVLRVAAGEMGGIGDTVLLTTAAVATIAACGWRQRGLRAQR